MDNEKYFQQFYNAINRHADIELSDVKDLYNKANLITLKKNEFFIREGDKSKKIGFNLNGLFRLYYNDKNGEEFTKGFNPQNNFILSFSSLVENRGSYFYIEAMKETNLLVFDYDHFISIGETNPKWYKLYYKLVQRVYIMKEERERAFLLEDATERYLNFSRIFREFEKDIKLYHIASYLGITPVALSRIRKKLKLTYVKEK